jgi:hypothetical protein
MMRDWRQAAGFLFGLWLALELLLPVFQPG